MSNACRVCGKASGTPIFKCNLIGREVNYFDCEFCGYVQTQTPTWMEEAYSSAINNSDYGIMRRNLSNVGIVISTMFVLGHINGRLVDFAGGYGILVRLLRDQGVDAVWSDPYCKNILAIGCEYKGGEADLLTAFEAFEHFVNPIDEIEKLFAISPNVLLSTVLISTPAPQPADWWYYGIDHGQHIGFFRVKTLRYLAEKYNKYLITDGYTNHLLSDKPISTLKWRISNVIFARFPILFKIMKKIKNG